MAMSLWSDLKVLYHMAVSPIRGGSHAERLESFYRGQAEAYDDFRARLLQGRRELMEQLPTPAGGVWVDLGGGTGANAAALGPRLSELGRYYVVDLSPSLLARARQRAAREGWDNVVAVEADATTWRPAEGQADVATFSYSLTMIPDWFAALEHAHALLKPGGWIGVVDFYVARKYPADGLARHPWSTRAFWPLWFARDNVFLSPDHLPYLRRRFHTVQLQERRAKLPYLPLLRAPYYWFVGRK